MHIGTMISPTRNRCCINKIRIILQFFHQNTCVLLNKKEELLNSLMSNSPQTICLTEHHLTDEELINMTLHPYTLGAKFCRKTHKCVCVCVCVSVQDNIHCTSINMDRYSNGKDRNLCCNITYFIPYHHYNKCLQISNW
jgi:hypothetical protein